MTAPDRGAWVRDRLGVSLCTDPASLLPLGDLVGVALRHNPRRAHLLVSVVLGKHVPVDPRISYGAGRLLGALVGDAATGSGSGISTAATLLCAALGGQTDCAMDLLDRCDRHAAALSGRHGAPATVVLGYAETATALGHAVADALDADYLHSTRRRVAGVECGSEFVEEHSHATQHLLLPEDPGILARSGPLVLVDDELSTGQTVLNTIAELQALHPRARYLIACLVDVRCAADRDRMVATAHRLGTRIEVVALGKGRLLGGEELGARVRELTANHPAEAARQVRDANGAEGRSGACWPRAVRDGGRHGFPSADRAALTAAARAVGWHLAGELRGDRVLVLGFEELMYAPLRIAMALAAKVGPGTVVRFSSTTRSPVLAIDDPGYPITTLLTFASHDTPADEAAARYAYN
ncbi:MAG: phosphoribosyltransferase family protein, partial [Sciscionella sp.]